MKTHQRFMLLIAGCLSLSLCSATEIEQHVSASKQVIKKFAQTLKSELMRGMQEGGPVNAIEVCNIKAPEIADTISTEFGGTIERTSLRVRNRDNAPDPWEKRILETFEVSKQAGADINELQYYDVITENGKPIMRYMKVIPVQGVCLACHGVSIDKSVEQAIVEHYPNDLARGFKIGDIRGAFSVRLPLDDAHKQTAN